MLNKSLKVPPEHLETMMVLREALYLMSGMEKTPDYVDFWQFRSRIFEPLMREIKVGTRENMHVVLEKWLLRTASTEETIDALRALEDGYVG